MKTSTTDSALSRLTRRRMLQLGGAAGAVSLSAPLTLIEEGRMTAKTLPAIEAADHLLLGVAELDEGIAWVERKTGIRAAVGGSHPGRGTRNALLSLGRRQYLEIIAPDPAQPQPEAQFELLRQLAAPRLIRWAAVTTEINAVAQQARAAGYEFLGPRDGSRARPGGRLLKWKTLNIRTELGGVIPFFIEWEAGVAHPSGDSPAGCQLVAFDLQHPQPERVREMLGRLGIEAQVSRGEMKLKATLKTPKGIVELE
jgi:hypothetical protein